MYNVEKWIKISDEGKIFEVYFAIFQHNARKFSKGKTQSLIFYWLDSLFVKIDSATFEVNITNSSQDLT